MYDKPEHRNWRRSTYQEIAAKIFRMIVENRPDQEVVIRDCPDRPTLRVYLRDVADSYYRQRRIEAALKALLDRAPQFYVTQNRRGEFYIELDKPASSYTEPAVS